ncbi:hypothetical protein V6N12_051093 [Hibiscus sabdariffa]|uniref:Uncharacterized protein n=1 Tax=Hibiscus sabdariffa TaxID=183260 RepID=A0ABR2GEB0_9ROSI
MANTGWVTRKANWIEPHDLGNITQAHSTTNLIPTVQGSTPLGSLTGLNRLGARLAISPDMARQRQQRRWRTLNSLRHGNSSTPDNQDNPDNTTHSPKYLNQTQLPFTLNRTYH